MYDYLSAPLEEEEESPQFDYLTPEPVRDPAQPSFDNRDWSALPGMERDKRSIDEVIARERELNPTTIGNDIARGVSAFGQSALRGLKHPFSSPKDQQAMEAQGMLAKMGQQGESTAFNVGRNAPPFMAPGLGAARTVPLMLEGAGTAAAMGKLDFDERASNTDLAGDAVLGAAVPAVARGAAAVLPDVAAKILAGVERVAPKENASRLARLKDEGFKLTPAEMTGDSTRKVAENIMQRGRPGARKAFQGLKDENAQRVNSLAARSIGESGDEVILSEGVMARARDRITQDLDDVVEGATMKYDGQFHNDLADLRTGAGGTEAQQVAGISPAAQDVVDSWIENTLDGRSFSGKDFQQIEQRLSTQAKQAFRQGDHDLGRAYTGIRDALDEVADRSLGGDARKKYREAKKQYANYKVLAGEQVADVVDAYGNVNPKKVQQALQRNKGFRDKWARGEKATPMDLIRDYSTVQNPLPSLPPVPTQGLAEKAAFFLPRLGTDYLPTKAYLGGVNRGPRGTTGAGAIPNLSAGMGGSQMTDTLFNAVIGNIQGGQQGDDGSGIWGSGLMDALQGMAAKPY